eukprot:scaffold34770_cov81-Phaeocystis_antarctica.AAC.2
MGEERTLNMRYMFVTLDVSKLSGWLNADAYCRESEGGHAMRGERAEGSGSDRRLRAGQREERTNVRVEILQVFEEIAHVGDGRDVPVSDGAVRRSGGIRVSVERLDRRLQGGKCRECGRRRESARRAAEARGGGVLTRVGVAVNSDACGTGARRAVHAHEGRVGDAAVGRVLDRTYPRVARRVAHPHARERVVRGVEHRRSLYPGLASGDPSVPGPVVHLHVKGSPVDGRLDPQVDARRRRRGRWWRRRRGRG